MNLDLIFHILGGIMLFAALLLLLTFVLPEQAANIAAMIVGLTGLALICIGAIALVIVFIGFLIVEKMDPSFMKPVLCIGAGVTILIVHRFVKAWHEGGFF